MECGGVRPTHLVGHLALELRRGPLLMGISTKGNLRLEVPGVPRRRQPSFPRGTTTGRLLLDQPSAPVEAASHDLTVVRLLSVPGVRQGELVGHPRIP